MIVLQKINFFDRSFFSLKFSCLDKSVILSYNIVSVRNKHIVKSIERAEQMDWIH